MSDELPFTRYRNYVISDLLRQVENLKKTNSQLASELIASPASEAKEKLAKFGAIIWKDCKNDNTGYPELSDEAYLFFNSLCKLPGIKEAVEELTK